MMRDGLPLKNQDMEGQYWTYFNGIFWAQDATSTITKEDCIGDA